MRVPDQLLTTKVVVETTIKHRANEDDSGDTDYLWTDPYADIAKAVKSVLSKYESVTDVKVRVSGDTSKLSMDFAKSE